MANWARIDGTKVCDITHIDPAGRHDPSTTWVPFPSNLSVTKQYTYDESDNSFSEVTYTPPAINYGEDIGEGPTGVTAENAGTFSP